MLTHIRRTMGEFIHSETGLVRQQSGLPMAWVVGTLVAMAVFFGTPDEAVATCNWGYAGSCATQSECMMYCQVSEGCIRGDCSPNNNCYCCDGPAPCGS